MWEFICLCLLAAAVPFAHAKSCNLALTERCSVENHPTDFPETEAELEMFCKFYVEYFECASEVLDDCDVPNAEYPRVIHESLAASNYICRQNKLLYEELVKHLKCIKPVFKQHGFNCTQRHYEESNSENFEGLLSFVGITDVAKTEDDTKECLSQIFQLSCVPASIGVVCNAAAREVAVEILQLLDLPFEPCNLEIKERFPTIVRAMELEFLQADKVENDFRR